MTNRISRIDDAPAPHSLDAVMALLADRNRRYALDYLARESDGATDLDVVAEYVCSRHSSEELREVRTALHHVHFPRLTDAGVVSYDPSCQHVHYRGSVLLESVLEVADPPKPRPA